MICYQHASSRNQRTNSDLVKNNTPIKGIKHHELQ